MTESDRDNPVESTSIFAGGLLGQAEREAAEPVAAPETMTGLESLASGTALLVVKRGPNAGSRFVLDKQVVTAGRHPESDIFLDDVTVSRRHAEFTRTDQGYEVADTGSLNGTYVNREAVESSALANGDEVQIGKFRLVFLFGSPAENNSGS
ncbi:oxoglutarate dehydrogenase inhibitor Odhl [Nakamurella antarctica]|nr:FHA domain-containing protein [Nakamurella antarctica]